MRTEYGFTLLEAVIAITLLGLIAVMGSMAWTNPRAQRQVNVAINLAEEGIEQCMNRDYDSIDYLEENGIDIDGVTFDRIVVVRSFDINSGVFNAGGDNELSDLLTNEKPSGDPDFNNNPIKEVRVTIQSPSGNALAVRTAIIARQEVNAP